MSQGRSLSRTRTGCLVAEDDAWTRMRRLICIYRTASEYKLPRVHVSSAWPKGFAHYKSLARS